MKYNNVLECYEAISQWLIQEAPEPWGKIVVDFKIIEIDDVCEDSITYTPSREPSKEKQFFIDDTNFTDCFFQLAYLTSTPEKGLFKKCKFTLSSDGRYKTDFEY